MEIQKREPRIRLEELGENKGKDVRISGWVHVRRDHGKLIFIDLRDVSGKVQMVITPDKIEAHKVANTVRPEWVIEVEGSVNERPEKMVNKDEPNGTIEIEVKKMTVLNEAKTPPFDITKDTADIDETVRLKYRYLDLRSERMLKNLKTRSEWIDRCRKYLFKNHFIEIETPILTQATPEGSRDFIVPSRLYPGKFYALPQSPQQYKQLLMASGVERYYQLAKCIRDEDLRGNRGFEHTQVDIEVSFVNMYEFMDIIEGMITTVAEEMGYKVKEKPWPKISYKDAMEKYGADKFDLRSEAEKKVGNVLAYAWVIEFPFFEKSDATKSGWTFTHNPFSMPIPEHLDWLMKGENIENILTTQYDMVCNGHESGGGSIRAHKKEILEATYKVMGYDPKELEHSVGHMLEAFELGTPPHGGIGIGVERNIMNLTGEEALRDTQAFPMTRGGSTSVMDAPRELPKEQLDELGIEVKKKKKD